MFRAFSRPSSEAQWLQWKPLVLPLYRGDSRAVFVAGPVGRPTRPRTQLDCHHDTKVKPEAATAVIELLMMGGETPETCWVLNKRQENKLENFCMSLVIYLHIFSSWYFFPLTIGDPHCSFRCSTFRITRNVSSTAGFCSESMECFPGVASKFV
jgi:hypothetical protein